MLRRRYVVCTAMAVLFCRGGMLAAQSLAGNAASQPSAQQVAPSPSYEVATVKDADPWGMGGGFRVRGDRLQAINTSLSEMIQFAYELQSKQLMNLPAWGEKNKFDAEMLFREERLPNDAECKAMVRQLLTERFGLKFTKGEQEMPVYVLVVAKDGPKLKKTESSASGLPGLSLRARGQLEAHNAKMSDLATTLQRLALNRPVIDQTGLEGRWDFQLEWTPDDSQFAGAPGDAPIVTGKEDLFTAIQEQLGLKLQATKAPAGTMVIEAVVKPVEN